MSNFGKSRLAHWLVILSIGCLLFLPGLGAVSLWDIDEGNNAEAAREMFESGNWVVPTFNYELRVDKPALLYWLQIYAYRWLGVSELSARLPSALAAIAVLIVVYELGSLAFRPITGLLSSLVLATSLAFGVAGHFANPDALLLLFATLSLYFYMRGQIFGGSSWLAWSSVAMGFAVIAKGPVGLALPFGVIILHLALHRRLIAFWSGWWVVGWVLFSVVALPWYIWVAVETKASFLTGFIMKHNLGRYLSPMENHSGPPYYYLLVLCVGLAPWSALLGLAFWAGCGARGRMDSTASRQGTYSLLWIWSGLYLVFFTLASTKLPNYVLPAYPAMALFLGRLLDRWMVEASLQPPRWASKLGAVSFLLLGLGLGVGFWLTSSPLVARWMPVKQIDLRVWWPLGILPVVAGLSIWVGAEAGRMLPALGTLLTTAMALTIGLVNGASQSIDRYKAAKELVHESGTHRRDRVLHLASFEYFQPSLVFYTEREVGKLETDKDLAQFLKRPTPAYVFMPKAAFASRALPGAILAERYDLYKKCLVVVVGNSAAAAEHSRQEVALRGPLEP